MAGPDDAGKAALGQSLPVPGLLPKLSVDTPRPELIRILNQLIEAYNKNL